MSGKYILEGHKSKTNLADEDTRAFDGRRFATVEKAAAKARVLLVKDNALGLTVIYKEGPNGAREGIKLIFKSEDGTIEDTPLYWGGDDCCYEG